MWKDRYQQAGERLRLLREQQPLSISKLECIAEIDQSLLRKIENGTRRMSVCNAIKLASVLNTTPTYLLFGIP